MPVLLDENMIGLDCDVIGFPHLLLCMGFVMLCEDGSGRMYLSGIHLTDVDASARAFPLFAEAVNANGAPAKIHAIYGTCNRRIRYGDGDGNAKWRLEMTAHAHSLGFKGPARGFDTSIIDPKDGTYVQYELHTIGRQVRIFYKRNEKMVFGGGGGNLPQVQLARKDAVVPEGMQGNLKLLAKFKDRIETAHGSKGTARVRQGGFLSKTKALNEVDYSMRLEERYVY